ncbi:MAG: rod shape-determining protein MreC [Rhodospirillaceae bacterium]|nr:rod shape-determining protein MreC [Rhodospirillaceae bacterium]
MGTRARPFSRIWHVRLWLQRFAFVLLLAASLGLLALGRIEAPWAFHLRAGLLDAIAPVAHALSLPGRAVAEWFASAKNTAELQHQNAELKAEVEALKLRLTAMDELVRENREFRRLLGVQLPDEGKHIAARVIADPGGPYVRSVLIRAGSREGVRKGRAVVTAQGLVGRVTEVGEFTSRVMLITDVNARTAVLIGSGGERAIMTGANADLPRLLHVSRTASIAVGDRVVSSGHDGILPPGIPIGEVVAVQPGTVRIRPFVDTQNLSFVRVVDHDMPGLLPSPGERRTAERPRRPRDRYDGGSP